jgi:hypothetical protein
MRYVRGHVEVFEHETNRFVLSADNEAEALHEIGLYLAEQHKKLA